MKSNCTVTRLKRLAIPAFALIAPALIACTSGPAMADTPNASQMDTVKRACAETMQLNSSTHEYEMCVLSLKQTVASLNEAQALQARRETCAARGLVPGSRDFAVCSIANN